MTLSAEQLLAAERGQDVYFTVNGVEFVVIRSEVFDKLKSQQDADHNELRMLLARSSKANGWDEPGMELYDAYPTHS